MKDFLERVAQDPVKYALRLLALVVVLVVLALSSGCAATPVKTCDRFSVMVGMDSRGNTVYGFDQENIDKLANTLRGLSEGTCRLEK